MCTEAGTTQVKPAQEINTTPINRMIRQKENVVIRTFTSTVEAIDCDIQLTYVKQKKKEQNDDHDEQ